MNNSRFKFRAWDEISKVMLKPISLVCENNGLDHIFIEDEILLDMFGDYNNIPAHYEGGDGIHWPLDNFKVMQWSGLTDKNGKDIYESDILRIDKDFQQLIGGTTENVLVGFKDGCFMYARSSYDLYYLNTYLWMSTKQKYCEIIGNVYQNKELLK